ncbi:hypothetical protein, partial [Streptomyces sp. NPDC059873]
MDPIDRGPDEYGHDERAAESADSARPPGTDIVPAAAPAMPSHAGPARITPAQVTPALAHLKGAGPVTTPPPVRTVQLISGEYL